MSQWVSPGIDLSKANELNRTEQSRSAARYLKRVKYGNSTSYLVESDLSVMQWMFEVVFDYDDHDSLTPTVAESQPWHVRSDPFSTYRPTFEIRLYRLCRRVLMFHNFPEEEIGSDCLVSSVDLTYYQGATELAREEDQIASFIASVTRRGYVRQGNGYLTDTYPPLEFEYHPAVVSNKVHEIDPSALQNLLPVSTMLSTVPYQKSPEFLHTLLKFKLGSRELDVFNHRVGLCGHLRCCEPLPLRERRPAAVIFIVMAASD